MSAGNADEYDGDGVELQKLPGSENGHTKS